MLLETATCPATDSGRQFLAFARQSNDLLFDLRLLLVSSHPWVRRAWMAHMPSHKPTQPGDVALGLGILVYFVVGPSYI